MRTHWLAAFAIIAWLVSCNVSFADDTEAVASPYFQVDSDNPGIDRLPLKSTRVDVRVLGAIADVVVTQQYKNEGQRPIEARYVFPGSTRSAVYAMNVQLGERRLTAKIREKQEARREYEAAKTTGKTAALLEQHRSSTADVMETLARPRKLSLEEALEFCASDECVEVAPDVVRVRKVTLDANLRGRERSRLKQRS